MNYEDVEEIFKSKINQERSIMSEVSIQELSKILEQDAQWMTEKYDELVA